MSEASPSPSRAPRFLHGWWYVAGIVLGLAVMSVLGRRAGQGDFHPGFGRFHPAISPEASYYPSVEEMTSIVRARCRKDQILVIVGGNSVLQGVSQPVDAFWTRKLQQDLGDRFCVINFAFRGASPTDGGAVIAEVLRDEFPRQIYIANEKPATAIDALGNRTYRFVFWQAYFRGMLINDSRRNHFIRVNLFAWRNWAESASVIAQEASDRLLRFHAYWNRTAFERLNTVPSLYAPAPPALFSPRRLFVDQEIDGQNIPLAQRYRPELRDIELTILRATSSAAYEKTSAGWEMKRTLRDRILANYRDVFPNRLRPRTLMVVGRDSAQYRQGLTPDELARDEKAIADTVDLFREAGYAAMDYGRGFAPDDYFDRTHLTVTGGDKLAAAVSKEVTQLARQLGYLNAP